jgi:hypothetical protein
MDRTVPCMVCGFASATNSVCNTHRASHLPGSQRILSFLASGSPKCGLVWHNGREAAMQLPLCQKKMCELRKIGISLTIQTGKERIFGVAGWPDVISSQARVSASICTALCLGLQQHARQAAFADSLIHCRRQFAWRFSFIEALCTFRLGNRSPGVVSS